MKRKIKSEQKRQLFIVYLIMFSVAHSTGQRIIGRLMNNNLERKVFSRNFIKKERKTTKTTKTTQSGEPVSGPRIESGVFRIRSSEKQLEWYRQLLKFLHESVNDFQKKLRLYLKK